MSELAETALSSLVFASRPITYGIVQPGPDISPDGVPLIRGKDYSSGKVSTSSLYHVLPEIDRPYARSKVQAGDLLLSIVGYVGQVARVPAELTGANITQTTARISVDPAKADSKFLLHYLSSPYFRSEITRYEKGSAQPGLNLSDVARLRVKRPSLQQQRRIAEILSTADEAIEQTEALIAKYQQIKAGLMQDLFTRGITPDGHLRPTRIQAPHLYKDSPLGWIPKEWTVVPLSSVTQLITSGSRGWAEYYSEIGPLFIRIGNLTREHINFRWDSVTRVSLPKFTEGQRTAVLPNDILISITADLGIVAVAGNALGEAYVNQHIALVRPKVEPEVSRFLGHFLSTVRVQKQFLRLNDSGAKAGLNLPAVGKILVMKPLDDLEPKRVAARLDEVGLTIECHKQEVAKLRLQKQGLMQDLLTGRVRVKVGEAEGKR